MEGYYPATSGFEEILKRTVLRIFQYRCLGGVPQPDYVTSLYEIIWQTNPDSGGNNHNTSGYFYDDGS